jgi:hypothetical protein
MAAQENLYIGRAMELSGRVFRPTDVVVGTRVRHGVLATDIRELAICKAIMTIPGIEATLNLKFPEGRGLPQVNVHSGWTFSPKLHIYAVSGREFTKVDEAPWTWISENPIAYSSQEIVELRDYVDLLRFPTPKQSADIYTSLGKRLESPR